jgi:hypothetical protein
MDYEKWVSFGEGLGFKDGIYVIMFKRKNQNILIKKREILDMKEINGDLRPSVKQKKLNVRQSF